MTTPRSMSRHLTPSLIISLVALVIATSSGAYAVAALGAGEVRTRHLATGAVTTPKLDQGAVTAAKVKNFSLRLNDLGGKGHLRTVTTSQALSIPAVLSNSGVVVPTVISETSQGGAIANLVVCASSSQSIPVGSVFHYQLIGPGN